MDDAYNRYLKEMDRLSRDWDQAQKDLQEREKRVELALRLGMSVDELEKLQAQITEGFRLLGKPNLLTGPELTDLGLRGRDSN